MHIYSRNLRIFIGCIIIDSAAGIAAGGINGDLIFIGRDLTATAHLLHRAENVKELADAIRFAFAADRVCSCESDPYKSRIGRQIARKAFSSHATAVTGQFHPRCKARGNGSVLPSAGGKGDYWSARLQGYHKYAVHQPCFPPQ